MRARTDRRPTGPDPPAGEDSSSVSISPFFCRTQREDRLRVAIQACASTRIGPRGARCIVAQTSDHHPCREAMADADIRTDR